MRLSATELAPRLSEAIERRRLNRPGIGDPDASDEGRGKVALVTGASSGVGWAMSELLAAKGYDIVIVARRKGLLESFAEQLRDRWGVAAYPLACDLGEPGAAATIRDELARMDLTIDFLVNNAGYVVHGLFTETAWSDQLKWIQVMALTPAELCRHLLPHMIDQGWGRIVNVSSVMGLFDSSPQMLFYSATKSFLNKFTDGLNIENADHGIHCTTSIVGGTDTPLIQAPEIRRLNHKPLFQLSLMRAEDVVRQQYEACMGGKPVVIHGPMTKAWARLLGLAPANLRKGLFGLDRPM